jgi:hypothetical protein
MTIKPDMAQSIERHTAMTIYYTYVIAPGVGDDGETRWYVSGRNPFRNILSDLPEEVEWFASFPTKEAAGEWLDMHDEAGRRHARWG